MTRRGSRTGCRTGKAQEARSTETGAYTLIGGQTSGIVTKNAGATYWIPSEDEWYKAAYNSPEGLGGTCSLYPTQSGSVPGYTIGNDANHANYSPGVFSVTQSATYSSDQNYLTDGGTFSSSASFYGTYDQGGNVWEWNDAVILETSRGLRGGSWNYANVLFLQSSFRNGVGSSAETSSFGFRIASVPEPTNRGHDGDRGRGLDGLEAPESLALKTREAGTRPPVASASSR